MVEITSFFSQSSLSVVVFASIVLFIAFITLCTYFSGVRSVRGNESDTSVQIHDDNRLSKVSDHKKNGLARSLPLYNYVKSKMPVYQRPTSLPGNITSIGLDASAVSFQHEKIQPTCENDFLLSPILPALTKSVHKTHRDENVPELGKIYFSISYHASEQVLKVLIQNASDLTTRYTTGTSDTYVTATLLPDKRLSVLPAKRLTLETKIRRNNMNPIWNEVLTYVGLPYDKVVQTVLYLKVSHHDKFSRDEVMGEVRVFLADGLLQPEPEAFVEKLLPCKKSSPYLGNLLISMRYLPTVNCVEVVVMKCEGLRCSTKGCARGSGPFIKVCMMYSGKKVEKKKTEVKKSSSNPVWNEKMEFKVPFDKKRDTSFVFKVMESKVAFPSTCVGRVIVGQRGGETSNRHWFDMFYNPRKAICMWHRIVKL